MTRKSLADSCLGLTFAISGRRVEIVHAMLKSVVDRFVDSLLVELIIVGAVAHTNCREAHTAITEQRNRIAGIMISPHCHRTVGMLSGSFLLTCRRTA